MSNPVSVSVQFGGKEIIIETGKLAKQAGGSAVIRCGDTVVLVAATAAVSPKEGIDFLPLTVDYIEKTFAAGKIPGGFFKREGRPTERETLTSRFIDRPIRPLFPEGYNYETQVIAMVLSYDRINESDMLAITGTSVALMVSDIPFVKPIAGCRLGRINGQFVLNPSLVDMEESDIDLIVAASEDAVVMVEGGAKEVSEKDMIDAIQYAHESLKPIIALQKELAAKIGKAKRAVAPPVKDAAITAAAQALEARVSQAMVLPVKQERYQLLSELKKELVEKLYPNKADRTPERLLQIGGDYENVKATVMRTMILKDKKRIDARGLKEIRPITCEVGILPRTHGSALFTRGETQALVVVTLGGSDDSQTIDSISGNTEKSFMLHYNFPAFSVGEVKPLRSPGRREVGHGALAERSLAKVMPTKEEFPYTVRIVSEILESNGSSSMATVCGGSLALMDAGVPVKAPVAGIAMGLIKEGNGVAILSDILGDEDHLGDMDFKVTGTANGVTALQMDIKIEGVTSEILTTALEQAREGRLHILGKMKEALHVHREELSAHAPKIHSLTVRKEKIKDVIGSGGKNIRGIIEATGVKIDINDDGLVQIYSSDIEAIERAKQMVKDLVAEAEVGKIYDGKVRKIMEFGAFVEILPKTDGLVHISELADHRVKFVDDIVKEGDRVKVKCIGVDERGKIKLSMKQVPKDEVQN
ncbi:MAG TPA: polyribonucleotide nucleotidyltransferase [Deltaproteobacteria bacterium]|nr:MAG: polyribonucleotide nucleotidyltransferase [Deltaproteobacteria bacterium GWA2_45_12]HBF12850.1 polyribonucleotide nucleotidyltransferase [Deltaproteobacteria bacterium]